MTVDSSYMSVSFVVIVVVKTTVVSETRFSLLVVGLL